MLFTERYSKQISGILHCYGRIIIQGTIPGICYAGGMTSYLYSNKVRIPTWCPFRLQIYFNGHNVLDAAMKQKGIQSVIRDNAIMKTEFFEAAQKNQRCSKYCSNT